jgi:DNA-binding PadR family transcriptional regulator
MKPRKPETPDRLTHADVLVLAMLAARPTHGYDLVTELGRRAMGEGAAVSRAQIYRSLKKLQRLRLITAVRDKTPTAGPERETYRLSAPGRQAMSKLISRPEWARKRPRIPFQMWLIMVGEAEPKDRAAALRARRKRLAEQI